MTNRNLPLGLSARATPCALPPDDRLLIDRTERPDYAHIHPPKDGHSGFPKLMRLLKQERAAHPNTITTFGGDLFSPSVMSGFTKGIQIVELMDTIGLNYAVPGNHEFDYGPESFDLNIKASKAV